MRCKCGARYPNNEPLEKFGETGKEIAQRFYRKVGDYYISVDIE
jgi:hypothetical protein